MWIGRLLRLLERWDFSKLFEACLGCGEYGLRISFFGLCRVNNLRYLGKLWVNIVSAYSHSLKKIYSNEENNGFDFTSLLLNSEHRAEK